ncbi:MAG: single-stranded DNA-binding protein [Bacteroidetes bacterium]|nr:MAG: single-stranded DNA-binding protein [Bacteroidota bacterium]
MTTLKNSVQLIGHLGADPKNFTFEDGNSKASFSMATSDAYKDKNGERKESTQWHNVVAFRQTAKIVTDYLHKGSEVAIQGKLTHNSYEDKEGIKRYFTEVVANEILMLDKKN